MRIKVWQKRPGWKGLGIAWSSGRSAHGLPMAGMEQDEFYVPVQPKILVIGLYERDAKRLLLFENPCKLTQIMQRDIKPARKLEVKLNVNMKVTSS